MSKRVKIILGSLIFVSLYSGALFVLAAGPFAPHATLDPNCAEGTANCFVENGVVVGQPVYGGSNNQVLYTDNSGNVFSDANFTRDSVTNVTHISDSNLAGGARAGLSIENNLFGTHMPGVGLVYAGVSSGNGDSLSSFFLNGDLTNDGYDVGQGSIIQDNTNGSVGFRLLATDSSGGFNINDQVLNYVTGLKVDTNMAVSGGNPYWHTEATNPTSGQTSSIYMDQNGPQLGYTPDGINNFIAQIDSGGFAVNENNNKWLDISPASNYAKIGDIDGSNNSTTFDVDDGAQNITASLNGGFSIQNPTGSQIGFGIDLTNDVYAMGDLNNTANGSALFINDATRQLQLTTSLGAHEITGFSGGANNLEGGNGSILALINTSTHETAIAGVQEEGSAYGASLQHINPNGTDTSIVNAFNDGVGEVANISATNGNNNSLIVTDSNGAYISNSVNGGVTNYRAEVGNQRFLFSNETSHNSYLSVDPSNNDYEIGDINGSNNGTFININDSNSTVSFSKPNISIDSVPYTFPSSLGGTGSVLTDTGSGLLAWEAVTPSWSLAGNAGTTPGTNFLGTTDSQDVVFKTNSTEAMRLTTDGTLVVGNTGSETYGGTGEENKMFFDPSLQAFRVGSVDDSSWDPANIGSRSIAIGFAIPIAGVHASKVTGAAAIAIGSGNTVTNTAGIVVGSINDNESLHGFVLGSQNSAVGQGTSTYVSGTDNTITASNSAANNNFAFGRSNTISVLSGDDNFTYGRDNSIASTVSSNLIDDNFTFGRGNAISNGDANLEDNYAIGENNVISSDNEGYAFGYSNTVSGYGGLALGNQSTVNGNHGVAIDGTSYSDGEMAFGTGTAYTPLNNGTDRAFNFGYSGNDLLTVLKNGQAGVGYNNFETTTGDALLQVNGGIGSQDLTNCSTNLVADANGKIMCGNGVLDVYDFLVSYSGDPGDNFHFTLPNSGTAPEIDFNVGGSRKSVIGYDNNIGGTGRTIYYNDSSGNGIYLYNNAGIAFGNDDSQYATNSFFVEPNLSQIRAVEGMKMGVGMSGNPAYTLDVGDSSVHGIVAQFTNSNGSCTINPTSGSIGCSSDERLKKNITDISSDAALAKILELQAVTYNWNGEQDSDPTHIGFIAQQVQQIFPEFVTTDDKGMLGISYGSFAPVLAEGIKALDTKVQPLNDFITQESSTTLASALQKWLGDTTNGITQLVADTGLFKKVQTDELHTTKLCVDDTQGETCLSRSQVDQILGNIGGTSGDSTTTTTGDGSTTTSGSTTGDSTTSDATSTTGDVSTGGTSGTTSDTTTGTTSTITSTTGTTDTTGSGGDGSSTVGGGTDASTTTSGDTSDSSTTTGTSTGDATGSTGRATTGQ